MATTRVPKDRTGYRATSIARRDPSGTRRTADATLADEVAVEIHLNQRTVVVTMASPVALEDLAVGFLVSEQYLPRTATITSVACFDKSPGVVVNVRAEMQAAVQVRERSVAARASCGLCGITSLDDAITQLPPLVPTPLPAAAAIHRAVAALRDHQPLNHITRAVHGAAWCTDDGEIMLTREDIGRHNALDKLLGARVRAHDDTCGFILITSRVSYEIVQKAAAHGVANLVAVSAPTTLAVDIASALNLNLIAIARDDNHSVYVGSTDTANDQA